MLFAILFWPSYSFLVAVSRRFRPLIHTPRPPSTFPVVVAVVSVSQVLRPLLAHATLVDNIYISPTWGPKRLSSASATRPERCDPVVFNHNQSFFLSPPPSNPVRVSNPVKKKKKARHPFFEAAGWQAKKKGNGNTDPVSWGPCHRVPVSPHRLRPTSDWSDLVGLGILPIRRRFKRTYRV